jgi:HipA-like protein
MRRAEIYRDGILAGILTEENRKSYVFEYDDAYFVNKDLPAISLTLPKDHKKYQSLHLFPIFSNMLSEGANRKIQSRLLRIDEADDFGILLATAQFDSIGALTVKPRES